MIATLMGAALAAAQPAPVAHPPAHPAGHTAAPAPMGHEQHQGMKMEKCCCCEMMKGGHDKHAPSDKPHRGR